MHFWIDKRNLACGFNGRNPIPSSLASGRRRNKPITPIHRFQSPENGPLQHSRRQNQTTSQVTHSSPQHCPSSTVNNSATDGPAMNSASHTGEVENGVCIDTNADVHLDGDEDSQLTRVGGIIKYGMWAFFGLITISVAVTKFFINNQGTFEMLLLCTLGMLSVGLFGSFVLSVCRTKTEPDYMDGVPQTHQAEADETMSHRDDTNLPIESSQYTPQQTTPALNVNETSNLEQPPPYDVAILLPKNKQELLESMPPPSYESATK